MPTESIRGSEPSRVGYLSRLTIHKCAWALSIGNSTHNVGCVLLVSTELCSDIFRQYRCMICCVAPKCITGIAHISLANTKRLIFPVKSLGSAVSPSISAKTWYRGSSLMWNKQTSHWKGDCMWSYSLAITLTCFPMISFVPSHPTTFWSIGGMASCWRDRNIPFTMMSVADSDPCEMWLM